MRFGFGLGLELGFSPACLLPVVFFAMAIVPVGVARAEEGVARVSLQGYEDCVELRNEQVRVVLGHHHGGRVLVYETAGRNVLYLHPEESEKNQQAGSKKLVTAGRFDVGPEQWLVRGDGIWSGTWSVEITGPRAARMTSQIDPQSKMQVVREFQLDAQSSRLMIRQTVRNCGTRPLRQCFWSRTFVRHGGTVIVPCDLARSLMPKLYTLSQNRFLVNYGPDDPAVNREGDTLLVRQPPEYAKMLFDAADGWVAYAAPNQQLFVKTFEVAPRGDYGEVANANLSVWYPKFSQLPAVEIEPIGPMTVLQPGEEASFSTSWWLFETSFDVPLQAEDVARFVMEKIVDAKLDPKP